MELQNEREKMKTTIVSAFLTNINGYRSIDKYIECAKKLLQIPVNKIIYIEDHIRLHFKDFENEQTVFRTTTKEDLFLHPYRDKITEFKHSGNWEKDTIDYMFVQCNKTEWVKKAIEENCYNSDQFIWLDFGIFHIMKDDEKKFRDCVISASQKKYDKIRIARGIPNLRLDIIKYVCWFFLGGIFGGDREMLLKFSDLVREKCLEVINKHKTISWEVNIWFLIHSEHPEMFDGFRANHNATMIEGY